jgi:hypothetical protein
MKRASKNFTMTIQELSNLSTKQLQELCVESGKNFYPDSDKYRLIKIILGEIEDDKTQVIASNKWRGVDFNNVSFCDLPEDVQDGLISWAKWHDANKEEFFILLAQCRKEDGEWSAYPVVGHKSPLNHIPAILPPLSMNRAVTANDKIYWRKDIV